MQSINAAEWARAPARSTRTSNREAVAAVAAIVAVKALGLLIDSLPRFFLWDSVTYLQGALGGPLPRDRSFLYSFAIHAFAVSVHSVQGLLIAQTLAGVVSAFLVYVMARRFFLLPHLASLVAALCVAIEPSQLFYERMMMAEAFGGMLWLGLVVLAFAYLRDGKTIWLPAIALAGIATISFRLNGTMVIIFISVALPLLRALWMRGQQAGANTRNTILAQFALSLACTIVLHTGYRHTVAEVANTPPGYIGTEGLFLLGFVAPEVKEDDFRDTGCKADITTRVVTPLADPRNRERQLWGETGIWALMQRECPNPEHAAKIVAERAFRRIGPDLVPMALRTQAQYFDTPEATWRMNSDLGRKGMVPLELIEPAKTYFDLDVRTIAFTDTATSLWFEYSRWWLTGCFLLSPLFALLVYIRFRHSPAGVSARMLALLLAGLSLSQFVFSPIIAFRYLHPFPPLVILALTALLWPRATRDSDA